MTSTTLSINFSDQADGALEDLLKLEQESWSNTTGQVTMADFYTFTKNVMYSNTITNPVSCELNSQGACTSTIYAYPMKAGLLYTLYATYGSLSSRTVSNFLNEEMVSFNLTKTANLSYLPFSGSIFEWVGSVYDEQGNVTSAPFTSIDSYGVITTTKKVYGTLKVTYTVTRHKYTLEVFPRTSEVDLFGSVIYGVYKQGISWLEITNPPNVDDLANGVIKCGGIDDDDDDDLDDDDNPDDADDDPNDPNDPDPGITNGNDPDPNDPDDEPPTEAPKVDRTIITDYCTQAVISDTITYV